MSWFPEWSSIIGAAVVIGVVQGAWRARRIRRRYSDHLIARFFGWPIDDTGGPTRVYWVEGVTRIDVENALFGHTDDRWGWLCRPTVRRTLVVANPVSWVLTIYGGTDLPLSLGFSDSALSIWGLFPIPLWLAVRRSVRLIADAPTELLDERLVALRDRTYVTSHRIVATLVGIAAALIIIANDVVDLNAADRITQLDLLTSSAYAAIWATAALPSVVLAWTLRDESLDEPAATPVSGPTDHHQKEDTMTDHPIDGEDVDGTQESTAQRRTTRRTISIGVVVLVLALVAGIITGFVVGRSQDADPELVWTPIDGGLEQATLAVPVDPADPDGATLDLRVLRRPADDTDQRIGSLLVNPGGPGFGAESLLVGAEEIFDADLLARFDIVGVDPRGTGESQPVIDCIDDYDAFAVATDLTPDDDNGRAAQVAVIDDYVAGCIERTGDAIRHMSTAATAHDLDVLRRALGEDTISYFGFSYGCELGATWVTLFPETVRAAVLDGCADPTADPLESTRQQAVGFQASVQAFLEACTSVGPECPIPHDGDPAVALEELWARAAEGGIPTMPGRPAVNESILQTAIIVSMYSEDIWPVFATAVAMGLDGDGSLLLQLADSYYQRREDGTWGNELEALSVISCMDGTERPSADQWAALATELSATSPLIFPEGSFTVPICDALPMSADEPVTITGVGAPPILVIGNTGDPATPFASTERMAAALESAVLVAVESNDHGGYGTNDCIDETIDRYLLDGIVPAAGVRC